jgi:hypothetical protein
VTSSSGYGGRRYAPYTITEQGVAMLSSVLNSPRAIAINIEIMRAFVQMRSMAATHQDLAKQLSKLQDKTESLAMQHDAFSRSTRNQLKQVFDALRELMTQQSCPRGRLGLSRLRTSPSLNRSETHYLQRLCVNASVGYSDCSEVRADVGQRRKLQNTREFGLGQHGRRGRRLATPMK